MKKFLETILLVDDSEEMCQAVEYILGKDHKIIYASNGRKAIELYKQHEKEIECVFLDIVMPDMDGLETFQEIRKINNDILVLFMSGYCHKSYVSQINVDDQCGFINKPFTRRDLLKELERISKSSRKAS